MMTLDKYEKEYIDLFGRLYEERGMTKALGQIYAVLAYKANSPEEGLTQQEIASIVGRSVSAVSRLLNKLEEMKYCNYIEELNESKRWERKYYMTSNIGEIAVRRISRVIQENRSLKESLQNLTTKMSKKEKSESRELIKYIGELQKTIDLLNAFFSDVIELGRKKLSDHSQQ